MKIDLSQNNPFSSYSSNFAQNFTFGAEFDKWVCDLMLPALMGDKDSDAPLALADIGAGSCYWASLFLDRLPQATLAAVDPSEDLLLRQSEQVVTASQALTGRLQRYCETAQSFSQRCVEGPDVGTFDSIYFMQSAHYVAHDEFRAVFEALAKALKPNGGRIVIQARNMTPQWYPWAFPDEWKSNVEDRLRATDMFYRADRYAKSFSAMSDTFSGVKTVESSIEVRVPCKDYWQRLEDRWIPTFMAENVIPNDLHRIGIDAMKARFEVSGRDHVTWTEKFTLVLANVG